MAEKVLTKKSFIGHGPNGRLAMPGEEIDVDEKGAVLLAGSTPVGNLTDDQLEAELRRRRKQAPEPSFGSNVADKGDASTGTQPLEMAPFRPGLGAIPQGIPPGTEEHNNTFIRPAPESSPAAVEVVVGPGAAPSAASAPSKPISAQNKGELLETARARGVEVSDDDTKADILDKLGNA